MIKVGILGASGYAGFELVRILRNHAEVEICALGANSRAGQKLEDLFDGLSGWDGLPVLKTIEQIDFKSLDVVFCALPHGQSARTVNQLLNHEGVGLVIDLSNDHRLSDYTAYAGIEGDHPYPENAKSAIYGLAEWYRHEIVGARLIANPGCYPTSILLPLLPLIKSGQINPGRVVANSASGTTGAGRGASVGQLHSEVSENFKGYGYGTHRHQLEIQEQLNEASDVKPARKAIFNPHLLPMNRGILSTITLDMQIGVSIQECQATLEAAYAHEQFVSVAPQSSFIGTNSVRGTNMCRLALHQALNSDQLIITSAIDNLIKGASGQAVQNMNIALDLDEGLGLSTLTPIMP